jgi:hypothetical protein
MAKTLSGQIVVATTGTKVQGPNVANIGTGFYIAFPKTNTGTYGYLGANGATVSSDVPSTDLHIIEEGGVLFFQSKEKGGYIENLNELWFDAPTNGDLFTWILG